jgi:hypothetical protein
MASDPENFLEYLETTTREPLEPTQVKKNVPPNIPADILGLSNFDLARLLDLWNSQIEDPQSDDEFEKSPGCSKILVDRGNRKPRRTVMRRHYSSYRDDTYRVPRPSKESIRNGCWWRFSKSLSSLFGRVAPTDFEQQLVPAGPGESPRDPWRHLHTEIKEPRWEIMEQHVDGCFFPGWNLSYLEVTYLRLRRTVRG